VSLQEYKRKRDFKKTPEPAGKVHAPQGNSFVIQKHAATRLHYDFRLEMEGVLRSWAVPKGPSLDPAEKRLAVHVEDHPLEYGGFEGIIPKGQYGGGTVLLWDRGTWFPEGDPVAAYRKGHIKFRLEGEKLHGGWHLVRLHGERAGENKENWLLFKADDEAAVPGSGDAVTAEYADSVETGRSIDEVAADPDKVWQSNRAEKVKKTAVKAKPAAKKTASKKAPAKKTARKAAAPAVDPSQIPGARKAKMPVGIEPALATLVSEPPSGDEWIHELKLDGYRILCAVDGGEAKIFTRHAKDWTDRFGPVAEAAAKLPVSSALLDGEVVVLEPDGTTSFQALQNALTADGERDLVYFVFDLLYLDGYDLRSAPLTARKEALTALVSGGEAGPALRLSDHVQGQGEGFYHQACKLGLEGIVAKRAGAPYSSGRGKDWLKIKCLKRQEFVIVGFTDPEGSRVGLGALLLAVNNEDGELVFAGKVGTGFDDRTLRDLRKRLGKLERKTPAFKNPPRGAEARRSHWVEPKLVGEVAFTEWTREGILRHPAFQGLREDKPASEVVREEPQETAAVEKDEGTQRTARIKRTDKKAAKAVRVKRTAKKGQVPPVHPVAPEAATATEFSGVRFTHPERVLFPEQGVTKRDLAIYYERIADWILPHISDRPLTLVRCPEGRQKQCFYQKHVTDQFPASVRRVEVAEGGKNVPYGAVRSLEGLLSLVQMGVLEFHIWGSHIDAVEKPDYVVFDLDPDEGLPWERVVEGATTMRQLLEHLGLRSFLKTTGGKGLHVCVPLTRRDSWDEVKAFTKAVSEAVVAHDPKRYTSKLPKASRKGKIFIDYLRNGRGATSICAYSTRARADAPVSTPLFWEELETDVRANTYTVRNLPERLEGLDADPWADFLKVRQSLTAAMKKAVGM
jgi:bifunctional non-homologous end joining protein LigD